MNKEQREVGQEGEFSRIFQTLMLLLFTFTVLFVLLKEFLDNAGNRHHVFLAV